MSTVRSCSMLLSVCRDSFRRRGSCWRLLMASRSRLQWCEFTEIRRSFCRSSLSLQSAENTEDALPEELVEMRSRMSKLHNVVSSKGVELTDYKPNGNEERNASNSEFLNDSNECDQFEDNSGQVASLVESIGKGLRKRKDVDVLINMPYGHVRFDSMNRQKSKLQPVSEGSDVAEDEVPSVKIVKDGHRVFSINVAEESEEIAELVREDGIMNETCEASSLRESEIHDVKHSLFDEQYFDDALRQMEEKQGSVAKNTMINSEASDLKPTVFDEQYFGDMLQHSELKHAAKQQEDDKQRNSTFDVKSNLFDEQYFHDVLQSKEQKEIDFTPRKTGKKSVKKIETGDMKPSIFEEQHFAEEKQQSSQSSTGDFVEYKRERSKLIGRENSDGRPNAAIINNEKVSVIDEQYFGSNVKIFVESSQAAWKDDSGKAVFGSSEQMSESQRDRGHSLVARDSSHRFRQCDTRMTLNESLATHKHDSAPVWVELEEIMKDSITDNDNTVVVEPITRREMKAHTRPKADVENPTTAYDLSMKIRQERRKKQSTDQKQQTPVSPRDSKWSGRVDSHGFKILQDQVIDVQQLTQEQVLLILKDSIIHEDDKLVVLDKPYGLPSHGGPGIHHSVGKLLEPLASKIDASGHLQSLYLVHRLDKETTGVMVLAKSLQVAEFLLAMFKKRQVVKHYWVITKSVPQPPQGIIDIPMAEGVVGSKYRMALRPRVKSDGRPMPKMGDSYEAVTKYRVLAENGSAALVQCTPETGVKHQIRCHLAFGLNTPVLGDHKYSHYSKMAPQRLHPEMLQMLGIRQAKVRHIPMHLHAKAIVLPEWTNGRNLFLSARLPAHFVQNMKWLKLKPPS